MNGSPGKDYRRFWESGHLVLFGRPLGAIFLFFQTHGLRYLREVEALTYARYFALFLLVVLGTTLNWILLLRTSLRRWERLLLLKFVFVHPAWLLGVMWVTSTVPIIVGNLLSVSAGCSFYYFYQDRALRSKKSFIWLILAGLLLMGSFYTYQAATASFFWCLLVGLAFNSGIRKNLNEGLWTFAFFGIVCGASLLFYFPFGKNLICDSGLFYCVTWVGENDSAYSLTAPGSIAKKFLALHESMSLMAGGGGSP